MGGKTSKTAMSLSAREVISRRHPNSNPASEATVPREPAKVSDLGSSSLPSPPVLGKFDIDPEMLSKVAKGFNIKTTPIKVRIHCLLPLIYMQLLYMHILRTGLIFHFHTDANFGK